MTTVTVPASEPLQSVVVRVIEEAKRAWEVQGETVSVSVTPVNGHAQMTSLASLIHEVVSGCVFLCGPGRDVLSRVRA